MRSETNYSVMEVKFSTNKNNSFLKDGDEYSKSTMEFKEASIEEDPLEIEVMSEHAIFTRNQINKVKEDSLDIKEIEEREEKLCTIWNLKLYDKRGDCTD